MKNYQFHTTPYVHQAEALGLSWDKEAFALLMEQGTGKTKVVIDNVSYLYEQGYIDAVVIIGPNDVHANWIDDEFPTHCPPRIDWSGGVWRGDKVGTKKYQQQFTALGQHKGLAVLAINVEAVNTIAGKKYLKWFCSRRKVFGVVDESSDIKTPAAKRTRAVWRLRALMRYRRILNGTPVTKDPFDVYAQYRFLDPDILGFDNFLAFKNHYAEYETGYAPGGKTFQKVKGFRHLDEMHERMQPHTYRKLRTDCMDLPERVYQSRYVELTSIQRKVYDDLREKGVAEIGDREFSASAAIVLRGKLQQVVSNFLKPDPTKKEYVTVDPKSNPRLDLLRKLVEDNAHGVIIWSRFTYDIDLIMKEFADIAVRYDGNVDGDGRHWAKREFQAGHKKVFVGNAKAAGRGLTLTAADLMVWYANDDNLLYRLQGEDRNYRIGQGKFCRVVDIQARDTVDRGIILGMRGKKTLADMVTKDNWREWI